MKVDETIQRMIMNGHQQMSLIIMLSARDDYHATGWAFKGEKRNQLCGRAAACNDLKE